jgi:hypothetical protein
MSRPERGKRKAAYTFIGYHHTPQTTILLKNYGRTQREIQLIASFSQHLMIYGHRL